MYFKQTLTIIGLFFLTCSQNVMAYIGPGLGLEAMAVVVGICIAIIFFFIGIVWYPIKKLILIIMSKSNKK